MVKPRTRAAAADGRPSVVFWGKDIAFFASSLARLLSEVGVEAVDLTGRYDEGRDPKYPDPLRLRVLERKLRAAAMVVVGTDRTTPSFVRQSAATTAQILAGSVRALADLFTVLWIALRFRALVYTWRPSISGHRYEYLLCRLVGCRTVLVLHGTEARPPYLDGVLFPENQPIDPSRVARETDIRWERLRMAEQGVDLIVGAPGVSQFLSRPVLDRELIGFPIVVGPDSIPTERERHRRPPRVLHAPTNTSAKGTVYFREIVERLWQEGLRFELDWSTDWRSHEEILYAIRRADIVLDQLFADILGGVFAREAMALGAVPIVGSHSERWLRERYRDTGVAVPVLTSPEDVEATLRQLIVDPEAREREREVALAVMQTSQSPRAVVERWLRILFDEVEESFFFDPMAVDTVLHGFAPSDHLQAVTRDLVAAFGPGALRLDHNPELRSATLRFAQGCAD